MVFCLWHGPKGVGGTRVWHLAMQNIHAHHSLCTLVPRIPLLERSCLPFLEWTSVTPEKPWKSRKPQMLTGVEHWFVVDPRWPPGKKKTSTGENHYFDLSLVGLLYSKAIITWQSRCHCKAVLIQETVSHSGVEIAQEKEVHLRTGRNEVGGYYLWLWFCGSRDTGHLLAEAGLEQREGFQAARSPREGSRAIELAAKVSEIGSFGSLEKRLAALDQESKESKPHAFKDGICSWEQNRDSDQNQLGQETKIQPDVGGCLVRSWEGQRIGGGVCRGRCREGWNPRQVYKGRRSQGHKGPPEWGKSVWKSWRKVKGK